MEAGQRRLAQQRAMRLAEKLGIEAGYPADPAEALSEALVIAQAYLVEISAAGEWGPRFAALDRVAAIASMMLRAQLDRRQDESKAAAEQLAREYAGRLSSMVLAAARRSVWVAANGDREAAKKALDGLEADLGRLTGEAS